MKKNNVVINEDFNIDSNDTKYKINNSCDLDEEDYKRKVVIVELCFDIKFNILYGLINIYMAFHSKGSVWVHYTEDYLIGNIYHYRIKNIAHYVLYGIDFENHSCCLCFRDKRIKVGINDLSIYYIIKLKI